MRSRSGVILLLIITLVCASWVLRSSEAQVDAPGEKKEADDIQMRLYDGLLLETRPVREADLEFMIQNEGVASAGENYNIEIEGAGTGLKPPTMNEWSAIASSFRMIDSISFSSPSALNSSKLHNQSMYFPPIGNQGAEGSCVSWSIGYYTKTWQEAKEHDWNLSGASMGGTWPGQPTASYQDRIMSPDFLYHQVNNGVDGGSYYSDNIYMCQSTGICSWKEMPYNCYNSTSWPSEDAWREAPLYRSMKNSTYYMYTTTNTTLGDLKTWIDGGNLATISINAYRYSSLSNDLWNNTVECGTGRNHANTIIGYDDNFGPYQEDGTTTKGAFLVANSWGKGWTGDSNSDGMYWISYECMRKKVQYVYLMEDMIGYEPKALALFNISHPVREECTVTIGIGPKTSPEATKRRFASMYYDGGPHPFPSNMMAYDITEFDGSVSTFIGYNYFIKVDDGGTSSTGSIRDFSIELFDDYATGPSHRFTSTDPVVPTTNGGSVYAELTATDRTPPRIIQDMTAKNGTTGDPLNFTVVVTDNGLMKNVTVEYRSGSGPATNASMHRGPSDSWFLNITAPDSLDGINYLFHASDTGGNWNQTAEKGIPIRDNDKPTVVPSLPSKATTGDRFDMMVTVTDNIEVDEVVIENWIDWGSRTNTTLTNAQENNYTGSIVIQNRLGVLHLIVKANDTSGNMETLGTYYYQIEDDDLPTLEDDLSDTTSTTGDRFKLSAVIRDNIEVYNVWARYDNGDGFSGNSSLSRTTGDTWELSLVAPDSTSTIGYSFHYNDTSDNWNLSGLGSLSVSDDDPPVFGPDHSPGTATTGEDYMFRLEVADNIGIQGVHLEYWFGGGSHSNVTMSGTGPFTYSFKIPDNSVDDLNYIVHASDLSSNWNMTVPAAVVIKDNDLPTAWIDSSDQQGTTGGIFTFDLAVSDNIAIDEVFVEYWFGEGEHENISINGSPRHVLDIVLPLDSTETLHYIFHAKDTSDNWNSTSQKDILVFDDDLPAIGPDTTPGIGFTGDTFSFTVEARDNIGIDSVHVEYWFGEGEHENVSMSGSSYFYLNIEIPEDSVETLHYIFWASDISGNLNSTVQIDVQVIDNDKPSSHDDFTNTTATTGDEFQFRIRVIDNLGIAEVWLEYWFGEGEHENVSMDGEVEFTYSMMVPQDSLEDMIYIVHFCDGSGNWNRTHVKRISVIDNDIPVFGSHSLEANSTTGDRYEVSIEVIDNIGIADVALEFWFGDGGRQTVPMSGTGPTYMASIDIPEYSLEDLNIVISVHDTSGLTNTTDTIVVRITDDIDPTIEDVEDLIVYVGEEIGITVIASDNIGIATYLWEGSPVEVSGSTLEMVPTEEGRYEITVSVFDEQGNSARMDLTITVLPLDNDIDEDGIPDLVEDENGLDREDPSDALDDTDEDGLTNLEEYRNGTRMNDDDSDDDGMPDGWEVTHGLDPLSPSSMNDRDGDGATDLEEFNAGTDPLVADVGSDDDDTSDDDDDNDDEAINLLLPAMAFGGLIILIVLVIVTFLLIRKKKNPVGKGKDEEEVMTWD
ncbi:MAG: hypothetical protein ACMUHY_00950 [Thermoplasmatota archaeon]